MLFQPDPNAFFVGRKLVGGDFMVYNEEGQLCVCIHNNWAILGEVLDTFKLVDLHWQSYAAAAVPVEALEALTSPPKETVAVVGESKWKDEDDAMLTSWLLKHVGALPATVPEESKRLATLLEQAKEDFPNPECDEPSRWPSEQVSIAMFS